MTQEFFTWTMLATYAGAVMSTTLITQLLLAATFFGGQWSWPDAALCLLNAVVVSLASNGAYEAMAREKK